MTDLMSGQQMCEYISAYLKDRFDKDVSPERIWNASPTGELFHVAALYDEAQRWRIESSMTEQPNQDEVVTLEPQGLIDQEAFEKAQKERDKAIEESKFHPMETTPTGE